MTEERKERITALTSLKLEDFIVSRHLIEKNNSTYREGIGFRRSGQRNGPIVYWDDILAHCGEECDDDTMVDCIIGIVTPYLDLNTDPQEIYCWEKSKDRVLPKLINAERNQERLENLVHRKYLDLAEIYCTKMTVGDSQQGYVEVTREMLEEWGIDQETLERQAAENMKAQGYRLYSMEEMLGGFMPTKIDTETEKVPLQILTNREGILGAAILANLELLKEVIGDKMGACYLLPSSVHELIVCPAESWMDAEGLREVVKEVNQNVVGETDYLSDSIYVYKAMFDQVQIYKGQENDNFV